MRHRRALRDGIGIAGLVFAGYHFVIVAPVAGTVGFDAFAYWSVNLDHPYRLVAGQLGAFPCTPIAARLFAPAALLPWPAFWWLWTALLIGTAIWLGWRRALLVLAFPPVALELYHGNVHLLIAAAVALGLRYPWTWAFILATKVTPGIGLIWFAVRREWRSLGIASGVTGALVGGVVPEATAAPPDDDVERFALPGGGTADALTVGAYAIWVVDHAGGRVVRFDPHTEEFVGAIAITAPTDVAWREGSVWVTSAIGVVQIDEKTGTLYTPTDSGSPDLVGIWRPGANVGANSTFAIDALTGKIKWGFQNHHHDIFDQDTMAAPVPVEITKDGKKVKVIVQTTKQGMMWIIDEKTGKPLYPYEERPVPQSEVPAEKSSPTQPFTLFPPPLAQLPIEITHLGSGIWS